MGSRLNALWTAAQSMSAPKGMMTYLKCNDCGFFECLDTEAYVNSNWHVEIQKLSPTHTRFYYRCPPCARTAGLR